MLRHRLNEKSNYVPYEYKPRKSNVQNDSFVLSEWKLAAIGLVMSLLILAGKIYIANRDYLYKLIFEERLISYESITSDGEVMLKYAWTTVVKYSRFWFPALCGSLATWFTWLMVYLDSSVPGVQPPSPFSPTKYKAQSGHTFHLNYIFAVLIGVLVFLYLFVKGATIQF